MDLFDQVLRAAYELSGGTMQLVEYEKINERVPLSPEEIRVVILKGQKQGLIQPTIEYRNVMLTKEGIGYAAAL